MRRLSLTLLVLVPLLLLIPGIGEAAILRNLKLGDRGEDVRELQITLNKSSDTRIAMIGPGSSGNETAYFGILTKIAVIKFQEKYTNQILKPAGLTNGTGFVGGQTRLFLLQLAGGQVSPLVSPQPSQTAKALPPKIISITPGVVTKSTAELTISGENFTPTGNSVIVSSEAVDAFSNLPSGDGKTIKFSFRFATADLLKKQLVATISSGKGAAIRDAISKSIKERTSPTGNAQIPVIVLVRNANGESNAVTLLVDMTEILKEIGQ
ncbi:MAG: hypothetical protein AAB389_00935 [Patescibacteria group bacterium]